MKQNYEDKKLILIYLGFEQLDRMWHRNKNCTIEKLGYFDQGDSPFFSYYINAEWTYDYIMMPIVEHLEKGDLGFKMCRKRVEIYIDSTKETIVSVKEGNRCDSLFKALVEFVKLQLKK